MGKSESYEHAFRGNRPRFRSGKGKRLSRKRSELVERTIAHVCEAGAGLRTWLQRLENVTKIHTLICAAFNLGLLMRKIFGLARPRNWEANLATALAAAFFMFFGEWMTQGAEKMALALVLLIFTILLCDLMKSKRGEIRIIRFFNIGTYQTGCYALPLMREMAVSKESDFMGECDQRMWQILFANVDGFYCCLDMTDVV